MSEMSTSHGGVSRLTPQEAAESIRADLIEKSELEYWAKKGNLLAQITVENRDNQERRFCLIRLVVRDLLEQRTC